ncbi:MAG: DUF2868 domain-containing protein [Gammaproteobacteria bacterium]|nr:DUF2868 domain-containing protein [Gammaproteobacteria bacterium]
MTTSNFDKRLLIEQIRYIETQQSLACDAEEKAADHATHNNFEDRLWQRARCLVEQHDLSAVLGSAARLSRYLKILAFILAAMLGALSVIYAITDSDTINIYRLLLLLLGFNFISMLLWLTGVSLNLDALTSGMLARLSSWLPGHLERKNSAAGTQADRAWLACHFSGAVGKWQFSKITHQLWLVYLLAGLACLVLLLMVRQYNFVWGTTLLSDTAFVRLTEVMSAPLQTTGFATPSAEQVRESQTGVLQPGAAQALSAEYRYHWAQFLLGALLCYGILPRILLWAWSALMYAHARRQFALDLYLPYYISLRQRLMPLASHGEIIDADTSPPFVTEASAIKPVPHVLPPETLWAAVELGDAIAWPPMSVRADNDLGQVLDRTSLAQVMAHLQSHQCSVIAIAVSATRSPDRGVQRTIASLMSNCTQRWLVLIQQHGDEPVSDKRLAAWYRLAEACQVPADNVISLSLS